MERRTERTERKEKFNRYEAKEQCCYRIKSPKRRAANCQADTDTRTAVSHQIHNSDTHELHYENFHRDYTEFLRTFVYLDVLCCIGLKDFEFFKSLNAVEKLIAHRSVFAPIFGEYLLCILAYCDNGYRDKRYAANKHESRSPINPYANQKQNYRRNHCEEELRKIARKINIKLFHSFKRNLR